MLSQNKGESLMTKSLRRKKFVDVRVQGALAWRLFCHWFAYVAIVGVSAFILQFCCNPLLPPGEHFQQLWMTYGPLLFSMAFLLPVFILDTIKQSHRFAGPILRLRRELRDVAQGEKPQRLKFRKGDFWQDLAVDYNNMIARLTGELEKDAEFAEVQAEEESVAELCGV